MAEEKVMQNIDISDFGTVQTLRDEDYVVISLSEGVSAKASVYLLKALFTATISPSIRDGVWYVGEKNTEVNAEGLTPQFRKGANGIEYKYSNEGNTAWRPLVPLTDLSFKFEDLTQEQRNELALTFDKLTEEEIAQLQQPAMDMIAELERVNAEVMKKEEGRVTAEAERATAETERDASESQRKANESVREANELERQTAESDRVTEYEVLKIDVVAATEVAHAAAVEARNVPIIQNGTWWVYAPSEGNYVNTGSPAVAKSPQIINGTWWTWDEDKAEYVDSGQAVSSDYQLTKDKVESVLTGDVKTHFHSQYVTTEALEGRFEGVVTGVMLNGATKNPTEGVVDLGTLITEHQDISGKQDKNVYFTNITASAWVSDSTYSDFAYRCDLSCQGVTPNDYAEVVFGVEQSTSGDYAPVCESRSNAVRIWSAKNSVIVVPTIIISK